VYTRGRGGNVDQEILAWAAGENATIVTLDADFHMILAVSGATTPSVIRLRRQGLDAPAVVEIVRNVAVRFRVELAHGSMVTVKANKITRHKLPIGGAD
jgi:predicted nuclease of predicted toxin-antitoxin system